MLGKMGFEVVTSTAGEDAAAKLLEAGARFDLVVTDLTMPKVDGLELCRRARVAGVEAPFLLITGNSSLLEDGEWCAKHVVETAATHTLGRHGVGPHA